MADHRPLATLQSPGNPVDRELQQLGPWFHNLHLPGVPETAPDHPLGDFPACVWEGSVAPHLPRHLTGWTALDIGCNAGFYSFELARRGARVVGLDADPHYLRQARWARARLGLEKQVELRRAQVYELAEEPRTFDLVLFMGVFYHLRYPLLALDLVARRCRDLLVFQSLSVPEDAVLREERPLEAFEELYRVTTPGWPRMTFLEHGMAGDPTNRWLPNRACMEALLRGVGFEVLARPSRGIYVARRQAGWSPTADHEAELRAACGRAAPSELHWPRGGWPEE